MTTEFNLVTRHEERAQYFELPNGRYRMYVPSQGMYTGTQANLTKWQQAGKEACLARCADIYDGERDKEFVLETFSSWPVAVLAAMCAEWDGSEG